ncbi:GNAT family N-acetyltransferase [Brevundimonas subvibrioides]|uniref:GCN5-related N-acetyltransferase n=1 Tax=Brevundimonas subvibrioides (strain ATCC 15264 / DSM 4735 / LMG 14903 / NBRC 16000 / CB 81) TaxID=633149 RepID=D9QJM2_BRESC|nr:GNAT family N-acetyltransferase [Brevundimonas subvibrioides]ADK99623.1 GCN5-related N-acetyltransferase [Brevundimonas subvibrioides ATCC 15264]
MAGGWRPMLAEDLDRVAEIAAVGFPDHFEGRDCFENRLALSPAGCFVLQTAQGLEGYLVAYPWRVDAAPPLNTLIETIPGDAGVMYLHDLALTPAVRGQGWSRPAVAAVLDLAQAGDWPTVALVAVNDAAGFWRGHGFAVREAPGMADKLASYGPDARYMTRPV